VSRLAKFFAGNEPKKNNMAAYTTQLTSGPSLFFGNILFYPVFASADSHRLIQKKTVFLKYIMWDF